MNSTTETLLKDHIIGLQHIGYVVEDLDKAIAEWQQIYGIERADITFIPVDAGSEKSTIPTRFAFFSVRGTEIELIQPLLEPFLTSLNSQPSGAGGINHLAWRVSNLEACYADLQLQGIKAGYVTPDGIVNFGNKKMLYLDPATTDGHLIELIEILDETNARS